MYYLEDIIFCILYNYHTSSKLLYKGLFIKKYYYDTSLKIVSDWKFYLQSIVLGGHSVAAYNNVIVICNPRGASSDNNRIKEEREKVLKDLLPAYIVNDYQCLSCLGEEFIENALFYLIIIG